MGLDHGSLSDPLAQVRAAMGTDLASIRLFGPISSLMSMASLTGRVGLPYQLQNVASTHVVCCINPGAGNRLLFSIAARAGMVSRMGGTAP